MKIHYLGDKIEVIDTGGEKYIREINDYLNNRVPVNYLTLGKEYLFKGIKYNLKFGSIKAFLKSNLWAVRQLKKIRKEDVLITNSYYRHVFIMCIVLAGYIKRCNVIIFVNAIYYHSRGNKILNTFDKLLMFLFLSSSSLVIANSNTTRDELLKLKINCKKIRVIYPRVDLPAVININRSYKNKGSLNILFVGYCDPCKEIDVLIKAVGLCKHLPFYLHIVGHNTVHEEYTKKLLSLIKEYDIKDKVRFYGRLEGKELVKMYALADIFVSPGSGEGYGRVLIEAMYYGLPVIGANRGASRELIKNGVNGFLFTPGDFKDLKNQITLLYENDGLRESMGKEGKKISASANFSKNIGEQFIEIIKTDGLIC